MISFRITEKQLSEIKKGNLDTFVQDLLRAVIPTDIDIELNVIQMSARDGSQYLLIERASCAKQEN